MKTVKGSNYPEKVLRLVIQVSDTPYNRKLLKEIYGNYVCEGVDDWEHSILKLEEITIQAGERLINRPVKLKTP